MSGGRLSDAVRSGDVRALARAISLVEDETAAGAQLIREIYASTGRAFLVGVTGPPGAGKSTLVDRLAAEIRRDGLTVGIVAVDPTSPFSGGALLGDRVRMHTHANDPGVFIRSMATRGQLGGLARATGDAALLLDAAGRDVVVIETAGVGQGEVDIVRTADVSIVVLVPGTGDDVQAIKAGIMEIGDIFVVNKSDLEGADRVAEAVAASLGLRTPAPGEWRPPIIKTQAASGTGVSEVWEAVRTFRAQQPMRPRLRQRERAESRLREVLAARLLGRVERSLAAGELDRIVDRIAARDLDPYSAAEEILDRVFGADPLPAPRSGAGA